MLTWKIQSDTAKKDHLLNYQSQVEKYETILQSEAIGFFRLPDDHSVVSDCEKVYKKFANKKFFVHVGIGGSSLGPEMLLKALPQTKGSTHFTFINNIDSDDLYFKLKSIDLKESVFYIVSKSGTTAETIAAFNIFVNELKKIGIHDNDLEDFFIFCTDPEKGDLRKIANKLNISCLSIPSNIGGRFSVLTPVGLLPALFAGISIDKILEGARDLKPYLSKSEHASTFFELATWIFETSKDGISQTVLMPYSSLLKEFSAWFVQLWAESLGKEGKGLTPVPAYGATDQHSQMQLFMEGPRDKNLLLLEIEKFSRDYSLKSNFDLTSFQNLSPYSLNQLFKAELEGTLAALKENNKNVVHFKIPQLDEYHLGQLILFFECLTVLTGVLLEVDPFNQPGVEAGKRYAYLWLKNKSNLPKEAFAPLALNE